MRLSTRLSAFFLSALAMVLVGFSMALFASAWGYLHRQVDDRLTAALAVLSAATEVHTEGVEWEPQERELPLGQDAGADRLRWTIHDDMGRRLDNSRNLDDADLALAPEPGRGESSRTRRLVDRRGRPWRVARHRVAPGGAAGATGSDAAIKSPGRNEADPPGLLHPALVLSVAAPLGPVERTLATLGWLLVGLSAGVWGLAAILGRSLIRRALAPLSRMVESARGLDAADPGWSIPSTGTGDELDDLGRAFNDLLARLHLAFERQRRFSSDASHQLRTPLTALIGQIEVALRRDRTPDEYRRVLTLVRGRAGHLGQIVEALLFLGRADAEAGLPESVAIDLPAWLRDHVEAHPLAPAIRIEPDDPDAGPLLVRAHAALLGQLVDNLLDNAAKYGHPGSPIVVRAGSGPGVVTLSVEDTGPGIDPADLPRVFEPFFRSVQARLLGRPGVGLGLAVVQRIAVAFGATIAVESVADAGSRFTLRLPRLDAPPTVKAEANHPALVPSLFDPPP